MSIKECCSVGIVSCDVDASITEVAALMRKHHVGDVVVVQTREADCIPIGIVTDRDIVMEAVALDVDADVFTAGDLMSAPLVTVSEDAGFVEALRLMRSNKVRRMPVVNSNGTLFGIVSADDIVKLLSLELSMLADALSGQPLREGRLRK